MNILSQNGGGRYLCFETEGIFTTRNEEIWSRRLQMIRSEYGKRMITSCGMIKGTGSCGAITGFEIAVGMSHSQSLMGLHWRLEY
ncbi:uncharacterized protein FFE2_13939 [Fusarium fujikuroi]|nr:uncharacterized protein FFE2_13939 [Fusarium fujikuroi]